MKKRGLSWLLLASMIGSLLLPNGAVNAMAAETDVTVQYSYDEDGVVMQPTTITLKDKSVVYNGDRISIGQAVVSGNTNEVNYMYYTDKGCTEETSPDDGAYWYGTEPSEAGTYYVVASVPEDFYYEAAVSAPAKLTIAKRDTAISLVDKSTSYTGKAIEIKAARYNGPDRTVTYTYYKDSACSRKTTSVDGARDIGKAPKKPGSYYVKASIRADRNYKAADSNVVKLTITKGKSSITLSTKSASFLNRIISIGKARVKGTTGKTTYTYYTDKSCTKKTTTKNGASAKGKAPKNAGTYYVVARAVGDVECQVKLNTFYKISRIELNTGFYPCFLILTFKIEQLVSTLLLQNRLSKVPFC